MEKAKVSCIYNFESDQHKEWPLDAIANKVVEFLAGIRWPSSSSSEVVKAIVDERNEDLFEVSLLLRNGSIVNGPPVALSGSMLESMPWLRRVEIGNAGLDNYLELLIEKSAVFETKQ